VINFKTIAECKKFDLHIHTNNSDGTDSWQTILQKAEGAKLDCISITDHDNCEVYFQMENPRQYFSGEIITGIEMQAYFKGLSIEILGYCFDVDKMRELLRGLYMPQEKVNKMELERLHAKCIAHGITFLPDVIKNHDPRKHYYATEYMHSEIRKLPSNKILIPDEESWEHYYVFFKRHIANPNSPLYINESDIIPGAEKVMGIIREAGGIVVLPHVYQYEEHTESVLFGLLEKLDGIECFYPSFTKQQTEYLLELCEKNNLLVTGGSDYHGERRPGKIGEMCFATEKSP
jgi:predicted metal-dependent phosphoesterase TrpH